MREEAISSGTVDPSRLARSNSPPATPVASSAGASSPAVQTNVGSVEWHGSAQGSKAGSLSYTGSLPPRTSLSTNAGGSVMGTSQPPCRPWDRGDLLCRIATFKPINWLDKPEGASSLDCARKGWINIDVDKIQCKSCGERLSFSTSTSGSNLEDGSTGSTFIEKLDSGHKVSCPWRGNCCADSLVQFPPVLHSGLIDGYKDRFEGLLQFPYLPVIASSTLDKMKLSRNLQIDHFLSQSYGSCVGEVGMSEGMPLAEYSYDDAFRAYHHAQKLISLCGWEPRWLLNMQDCEEHSAQSARNAYPVGLSEDRFNSSKDGCFGKRPFSASAKKDTGKKKLSIPDTCSNSKIPLLDCSLCGATVKILNFVMLPRPTIFSVNIVSEISKKVPLTHGISATSGVGERAAAEGIDKERMDDRYEVMNNHERKHLNAVDLNLTMSVGPSSQFNIPATSVNYGDVGLGRDLQIGQPVGSEVGDRAASYESRGPSPRKNSLEEGASAVGRRRERIQQVDSVEGTVIDREGDEVDDGMHYSGGPNKRARSLDILSSNHSVRRLNSFGAGPSRTLGFDLDADVHQVSTFREEADPAAGLPSARASSVIAMDTIYRGTEENSMESVENHPADVDDAHFPSPSRNMNIDMNDPLDFNYSSQAQLSANEVLPAALESAAGYIGNSSNEEEIFNAETVTAHARDRISLGISGGSVGMGESHEAEIHGADLSVHRGESMVGDAEPIGEVTENLGQMGESASGPGVMGEFVPEEVDREDRHGDSQDVLSQSVVKADSGSKIYGSAKADSVESGEKANPDLVQENSAHPSLSCNAQIYSSYEVSKGEVTQAGKASDNDESVLVKSNYVAANQTGNVNGDNLCEENAGEFDPIAHHHHFCPWVNGNVAAAGYSISSSSTASPPSVATSGWELTLDALHSYQTLGQINNQVAESESAASLYKERRRSDGNKLFTHSSASKNRNA